MYAAPRRAPAVPGGGSRLMPRLSHTARTAEVTAAVDWSTMSVSGTAAGRAAVASIRAGSDTSRRAGPPAWACSSRAGQPGRCGLGTAISASSTDN